MEVWKLSIKPESNTEFSPFEICQKKNLIGIGWSRAFQKVHPQSDQEAESLVIQYPEWKLKVLPGVVRAFAKELKDGDFVWIHQKGKYFLCRVNDSKLIYGRDIDDNFIDLDLGHARNADWIEITDDLVSGTVQRGVIARKTFQRINLDKLEQKYCEQLYVNLKSNAHWKPFIDFSKLSIAIANNPAEKILPILSPDDLEDIIAFYLQEKAWRLIKSTCFRSKPEFEFSMIDSGGNFARVQVKSSSNDQLRPIDYQKFTKDGSKVFLFSIAKDPYPGEPVDRVIPISHTDIYNWIKANVRCLSLPIKTKLMLWAESA